jgi:hypothetical protein
MRDFQFYEKFALNRERLSAILRCTAEDPTASKKTIAAAMGVNPYMVSGFRGWFCKTGLGTMMSKQTTFTPFAHLIARYDPYMEQDGTLWGLHYHLATSTNQERAEVWYQFFNTFATPGKSFTSNELQRYMDHTLAAYAASPAYIADDRKELLKCYASQAALGPIGLLHKEGEKDYRITGSLPDAAIVAYIVFDSWQRLFPTYDTLRLTQLCETPEMVGRICIVERVAVQQAVGILQSQGYLTFADTQHEPVSRRFHDDPLIFLEQYYQSL